MNFFLGGGHLFVHGSALFLSYCSMCFYIKKQVLLMGKSVDEMVYIYLFSWSVCLQERNNMG